MGVIEELDDDDIGICPVCQKNAETKCTACKKVFYCSRECQKKHWKQHKFECQSLPYRLESNSELGRYLVAGHDLKEGDVIVTEAPLVLGPIAITAPVCLNCYAPVDGSFKCRRSGWPLCGPACEEAVAKNPEVIVPQQTQGTFEIDSYDSPCYLYECVTPMRALLLQKSSPKRFKKVMALEAHLEQRRGTDQWKRVQERVVDVMKKTLGVMVFEALCPQLDFSDEVIQRLVCIFETNSIEIRLAAQSEVSALYEVASMLEHSCLPNVRITFDEKFNITLRAGRDIAKGEHLSIMYTHCLWGTAARREHLHAVKHFWCACVRCQDPTEFGTEFSTVVRNGKRLRQKNPLDRTSPWVSEDGAEHLDAEDIADDMARIGTELSALQMGGSVDDYEAFVCKYEQVLHPNHFHLATAKHSLLQMLGRTEGYLIQDLNAEQLGRKEHLCRELVSLCKKLDPQLLRLQIFAGVALYELHMPLLQTAKRAWEAGTFSTEQFRVALKEPHGLLLEALDALKDEVNPKLSEGQLRLQIKDTLAQLEAFMKTVGCTF